MEFGIHLIGEQMMRQFKIRGLTCGIITKIKINTSKTQDIIKILENNMLTNKIERVILKFLSMMQIFLETSKI